MLNQTFVLTRRLIPLCSSIDYFRYVSLLHFSVCMISSCYVGRFYSCISNVVVMNCVELFHGLYVMHGVSTCCSESACYSCVVVNWN
jgi:hypothetical protein